MIYIIDPASATLVPCKVYCHIKPCYGIPPVSV